MKQDPQEKADWEDAKTAWGGPRKGAGRKPRPYPREALTLKLEPEVADAFRALCISRNLSQSAMMTELVTKRIKH